MTADSILEKLQKTNAEAEIWWDSSPLLFESWSKSVLDTAPAAKRATWAAQLDRLFDFQAQERSLFRGVTTNPTLMANSILGMSERWNRTIGTLVRRHPDEDVETIYWMLYQEAVKAGAERLMPQWEASQGRFGWVSGQVDPRHMSDADLMTEQGLQLARLAPNVMVKVPGNRQGYETIRRLTARGIATNGTLSYTVPQFLACIRAVEEGLAEARRNGIDTRRWRSVVTHMIGRFGAQGDLMDQAERRGIEITAEDIRWAEIAIFKRISRLIEDNGHPTRMLLSSMKIDDTAIGDRSGAGAATCWHLEKTAGTPTIYTCPPHFIAHLMAAEDRFAGFDPDAAREEPPAEVMEKLSRLPYFQCSYEPDGMQPDDFAHHGAFVATAGEVSKSARRMVDFVAKRFQEMGHSRPLRSRTAPATFLPPIRRDGRITQASNGSLSSSFL